MSITRNLNIIFNSRNIKRAAPDPLELGDEDLGISPKLPRPSLVLPPPAGPAATKPPGPVVKSDIVDRLIARYGSVPAAKPDPYLDPDLIEAPQGYLRPELIPPNAPGAYEPWPPYYPGRSLGLDPYSLNSPIRRIEGQLPNRADPVVRKAPPTSPPHKRTTWEKVRNWGTDKEEKINRTVNDWGDRQVAKGKKMLRPLTPGGRIEMALEEAQRTINANPPSAPAPAPAPKPQGKDWKDYAIGAGAGGAAGGVLGGVIGALSAGKSKKTDSKEQVKSRKKKRVNNAIIGGALGVVGGAAAGGFGYKGRKK